MRSCTRVALRSSPLAMAVLATIGGCAPEPRIDAAEVPIVDGSPSPSDDAVVFLLGSGFCSGTLIAPRVVLTAKHCVVPEGAPGPVPARNVNVGIGESFAAIRGRYAVERIITTPGPLEISTGLDPVFTANGSDVALLILRRPIEGITPIPVRRTPPDDLVGQTLLAIGFGTTRTGSSGLRLQTDALLTRTTPVLLEGIEVICQGDSGGPLLATEDGVRRVVGVASFGVFRTGMMVGGCPAAADYWNRVDIQLDLIDRALLHGGECVLRGDEQCNGIDDDCNGVVDDPCVALGGTCTLDTDCAFAPPPETLTEEGLPTPVRCVEGICTLSCDAREPLLSCAAIVHPFTGASTPLTDYYCRHDGGCAGTCVPGGPGPGAPGTACTSDGQCSTLACDLGVCSSRCVGDTGSCPAGEACYADAGQCGICASASGRPTGRGRGEPCTTAAECTSGLCGRTGECSLACVFDLACGANFHCEEMECVRGARSDLGEYCDVPEDCDIGSCGVRGAGHFCGALCETASECTTGDCVLSGDRGVCAPELLAFGEACATGDMCESGACLDGLCGAVCSATRFCPIGTRCVRDGADTVCRPAVAGGCSVGSGRPRPGPLAHGLLLLLGVLWLRRSR